MSKSKSIVFMLCITLGSLLSFESQCSAGSSSTKKPKPEWFIDTKSVVQNQNYLGVLDCLQANSAQSSYAVIAYLGPCMDFIREIGIATDQFLFTDKMQAKLQKKNALLLDKKRWKGYVNTCTQNIRNKIRQTRNAVDDLCAQLRNRMYFVNKKLESLLRRSRIRKIINALPSVPFISSSSCTVQLESPKDQWKSMLAVLANDDSTVSLTTDYYHFQMSFWQHYWENGFAWVKRLRSLRENLIEKQPQEYMKCIETLFKNTLDCLYMLGKACKKIDAAQTEVRRMEGNVTQSRSTINTYINTQKKEIDKRICGAEQCIKNIQLAYKNHVVIKLEQMLSSYVINGSFLSNLFSPSEWQWLTVKKAGIAGAAAGAYLATQYPQQTQALGKAALSGAQTAATYGAQAVKTGIKYGGQLAGQAIKK